MSNKLTLAFLMLAAFLVGASVMSLEMLASRYLNPYFGGTIFTWAALISVVLMAMMAGYFLGGYSADKLKIPGILEIMICLAGLYMLTLPLFVDQMMDWVVSSIENVRYGALLGALVITGPPVILLSTFTPIAIRRSLHSLDYAGRIAGSIFAISTAGNIVGTLLTSFYLIPSYGTRQLTSWLAIVLAVAVILVWIARRRSLNTAGVTVAVAIGVIILAPFKANQALAIEKKPGHIIEKKAAYPEGPVFIDGKLYYTEMTRNRVMKLEADGPTVFFIKRAADQRLLLGLTTTRLLSSAI